MASAAAATIELHPLFGLSENRVRFTAMPQWAVLPGKRAQVHLTLESCCPKYLILSVIASICVGLVFANAVFIGRMRTVAAGQTEQETLAQTYRKEHSAFSGLLHQWSANHTETFDPPREVLVTTSDPSASKRVLVIYAYADSDWRRNNLGFFFRHGLTSATEDGSPVDYTFVFNGIAPLHMFEEYGIRYSILKRIASDGHDLDMDADITGHPSTKREDEANQADGLPLVRVVVRENAGFDFCAVKKVVEYGWAARPGRYTHVVLINASVRGPFMPNYAPFTWVDAFINAIQGDIKLVGTTVNCMVSKRDSKGAFTSLHLQSMVLATDATGLSIIHPQLGCYETMMAAISHGEIGATQALLSAGYGAVAMQSSWNGYPIFAKKLGSAEMHERCSAVLEETGGDPSLRGAYLGGEVHPYELIFIKTNRQLSPAVLDRFTALHDKYSPGLQARAVPRAAFAEQAADSHLTLQ